MFIIKALLKICLFYRFSNFIRLNLELNNENM